jgi:multidrug efflux pump
MSLTRQAITKDRITLVVLLVVLFAGARAYLTMPRSEDPGFVVRIAMVMTVFPGASPERVEQLVTDPLEKAVQEMPEIDFVNSESSTGLSLIFVNVQGRYTDMRPIWDSLRRKVERVRADLPDGIIGPTVDDEFGDVFGVIVGLTGEGFSYAELKKVADRARDELLLVDDVAKVGILGAQKEHIFIEFDNARLSELGLSPQHLQQTLQSRNIILPGGAIAIGGEHIVLEPTGNIQSVEDLRRTIVDVPGLSGMIYLGDLANIRRGYADPPRALMRTTGVQSLGLAINLRDGGNVLAMGKQVKETIARLESQLPIGIEFEFVAFQPREVERKVNSFVGSLVQAVGIVIAVMVVTLGLRTGLVVGALIPSTIIVTLLVMSIMNIGLDMISLASLIIALGMLVDNAIVMSEATMVKMAGGSKPIDAAVDSANELRIPLLTSSLTTAAAFLPIYLAESDTGEYTAPLFKVVTISLLVSWLLSLTVIPLLCTRFLKVKPRPQGEPFDSPFYRRYRGALLFLLRRRWLSLAAVLLVFTGALVASESIPQMFFPPNDKAVFTAALELPTGTDIERTDAMVADVEEFVQRELAVRPGREEGIVNWAAFVGESAPRFVLAFNPEPNRPELGYLLMNGTSLSIIQDSLIPRLEAYCAENLPDVTATIGLLSLAPPSKALVEVRISGTDVATVFELTNQARAELEAVPGVRNVRDDWGPRTKKLMVRVHEARARRAGLTNMDIALSLYTILSGYDVTQYREGDQVIPVTMRAAGADRRAISALSGHSVFSQMTGLSTPLNQVADLDVIWQPSKVYRRDRLQTVTLRADVTPGVSPIAVSQTMQDWLRGQQKDWPLGYRFAMGGEMEASGNANESINKNLPLAGLIIVVLLVAQFNSVLRPAIILLTIPLGLIGVIIGLLVTQSYFGFMTLLGVVALAGIVINNAIVLLDRIHTEIDENGLEPARAVVVAAQHRLRPILLTTGTTVGGLLPLWFGGGPLWEPMAITIIFGLVFATALTLGVVPLLYSALFRVRFRDFHY